MSRHLSFTGYGKAAGGQAKVRTGLGKSDCPRSQGGLRKRDAGSGSHLPRSWKRWIQWKLLAYTCARRISIPTIRL